MIVFVLTDSFHYEGESPLGVFSSLPAAQERAISLAVEVGREPVEWTTPRDNQWEASYGSSRYIIRKEAVLPFTIEP